MKNAANRKMNPHQQWKYARLLENAYAFSACDVMLPKHSWSCGKNKLDKTPQARYELRRLGTCPRKASIFPLRYYLMSKQQCFTKKFYL